MKFSRKDYSEVGTEEWDKLVVDMEGSVHFNCSYIMEYFCALSPNILNCSFIVYNDRKSVVSVCSLFVIKDGSNNEDSKMLPYSVISIKNDIKPGIRRSLIKFIFSEVDYTLDLNNFEYINFVTHPLKKACIDDKVISSENIFELQSKCSIVLIHNTLISNLTTDIDTLFQDMNKYRRRHIKKSINKNLVVKHYNNSNIVDKHINSMKLEHHIASGHQTRPDSTWQIMLANAKSGHGTIFVAYTDDGTPISYLYCGEFSDISWGWSQVNVHKYEKEWSPRALLEWEAMKYYKKKRFRFYEIGERFYENAMYKPTNKEISISEFKERYGTSMYPKIYWRYEP
jgi:hypothetical protein